MESISMLDGLEKIPIDPKYINVDQAELINMIYAKDTADCFIEAAFAAEIGLLALFDSRNVPDKYFNVGDQFGNTSKSLYNQLLEMRERGPASELGFINSFKGRLFENELIDKLKDLYPGFDFQIAANPNQPVFDIIGSSQDSAEEILIQAKMWQAGRASGLEEIMRDNLEVLYATSSEIREKIIERSPELVKQFIPVDVTNSEFTEVVKNNLDVLIGNRGIDVPDQLGDVLPYIKEVVLGIRLLYDIVQVHKDYRNIVVSEKRKLCGLKAIALFSRFGITTVCVFVGGFVGNFAGPGPGTIIGSLSGAVVAGALNKKLKPIIEDVTIWLLGIDPEDLFYYNNKQKVDDLALSYNGLSV